MDFFSFKKEEFLMKRRFSALMVMALIIICLFATDVLAKVQIKSPPKPPVQIPVKPVKPPVNFKKIPQIVLPDLVIENFTVNAQAMTEDNSQMHFPVTVTIRNIGDAQVGNPFYIVFEYFRSNLNQWQPDRTRSNAIRVNMPIIPGHSVNIPGELKIGKVMGSDRDFRVRAVVDSLEFEEFPPEGGEISESNENNNVSSETTLSTPYVAQLTGIDRDSAVRGVDEIFITGTGLGEQSSERVLMIDGNGQTAQAEVTRWTPGGINFRIPGNFPTGDSRVYIAESATLQQLTSSQPVIVTERRPLKWVKFMDAFNLIGGAFSIRLHTWSGGSGYENVSEMTTLDNSAPASLNVPKIQFKTDVGYYRFLVNDFKTLDINQSENAFSVDRQGCADNQMRLLIRFESQNKELIGYYKVLGPAGKWRRQGAPDIHVNNGLVTVRFQFFDPGTGSLGYNAAANFTGDISASGKAWNAILDLFMSDWDNKVRKQVNTGIRHAINSPDVKQSIIASFMEFIHFQLGLGQNDTIRKIDFTSDAIVITYY